MRVASGSTDHPSRATYWSFDGGPEGYVADVAEWTERLQGWWQERLSRPTPVWQRILLAVMVVPTALEAFGRRGWVAGAITVTCFGGLATFVWFDRARYHRWVRRHRFLDGLPLIPLVLLATSFWTSWSLWACAAVGVVAYGATAIAIRVRFGATP